MSGRIYTCKTCGASFDRYYAVSLVERLGGFQHYTESLVWHFITHPECNAKNAERIKQDRIERDNEAYHREMDMI